MSSSFVEFNGFGFWASDSVLEVWLFLLGRDCQRCRSNSHWLAEAGAHWVEQATGGYDGAISPRLDEYVTSGSRLDDLAAIVEDLLFRLSREVSISGAWLDSEGTGGPRTYFAGDPPASLIRGVGEVFLSLLKGELSTTTRTSPVY